MDGNDSALPMSETGENEMDDDTKAGRPGEQSRIAAGLRGLLTGIARDIRDNKGDPAELDRLAAKLEQETDRLVQVVDDDLADQRARDGREPLAADDRTAALAHQRPAYSKSDHRHNPKRTGGYAHPVGLELPNRDDERLGVDSRRDLRGNEAATGIASGNTTDRREDAEIEEDQERADRERDQRRAARQNPQDREAVDKRAEPGHDPATESDRPPQTAGQPQGDAARAKPGTAP
jgi:hypothetical protein